MPQKTLYAKMREIQRQTGACQRFLTDLTTYDKKTISEAKPGDMFWWIPYHTGTHLFHTEDTRPKIKMQRGGDRFEFIPLKYCVTHYATDELRYVFHLTVGRDGLGSIKSFDLQEERFVMGGVDVFEEDKWLTHRGRILMTNKTALEAKVSA